MKFLLKILDRIIEFMEETDNCSLIAKIFGVYTIKSKLFVPVHLILMENTVKMDKKTNKKVIFDLKGSYFRRYTNLGPTGLEMDTQGT